MASLNTAQITMQRVLAANTANHDVATLDSLVTKAQIDLKAKAAGAGTAAGTFKFRKEIQAINKNIKAISANNKIVISDADKATLTDTSKSLLKITDFAPLWVIATISISLGIGTMIGWKRIVVTIGEKIGNEHLNYAQGAVSEIVAAGTIGLSTGFGLPVSTTHVLSSGIAGAMVASGGTKNLNNGTLKSIAMAWILTLPVCIALALVLFAIFHLFV